METTSVFPASSCTLCDVISRVILLTGNLVACPALPVWTTPSNSQAANPTMTGTTTTTTAASASSNNPATRIYLLVGSIFLGLHIVL